MKQDVVLLKGKGNKIHTTNFCTIKSKIHEILARAQSGKIAVINYLLSPTACFYDSGNTPAKLKKILGVIQSKL